MRQITILLLAAITCSCAERAKNGSTGSQPQRKAVSQDKKKGVQQDQFVEFGSVLGNSLLLPSQFSSEEKGDTWTPTSPDGNTKIDVFTFTVEGSGSPEDFKMLLEESLNKNGPWKAST